MGRYKTKLQSITEANERILGAIKKGDGVYVKHVHKINEEDVIKQEDISDEEKNDWGKVISIFKKMFCEIYNNRSIPSTEITYHIRRYIQKGISEIEKGQGIFGKIVLNEDNIKWFIKTLEREINNTCVRDRSGSRIVSQTVNRLEEKLLGHLKG